MEIPGSAVFRKINPWIGMTERRHQWWRRLSPPQLFVGSFLSLILTGTMALKVLPGLYTGEELSWLNALFTATSAVCVTGLIVVDTATYFTPFGQGVLLLLIQLGGLGMITFTTLIIVALGRRLSLRQESISQGLGRQVAPQLDTSRLTRDVVRFTFFVEALGAALLYALWVPESGWRDALWPAVFHAVSAFCNAGFSIFSDSLIGMQQSPAVLGLITGMIVIGSLGFLTLEELAEWRRSRRGGKQFRLSIHSRLALYGTGVLIMAGWIAFAVFEWNVTLAPLDRVDKLVNALLMSVTPRTAGFNSIAYGEASESTNFLTIILMFIGGSPGSTAGGIKTTTFLLIGLLALSRLRGQQVVSVAGRTIPEETIQRAVGLAVAAFTIVTASIFVFTWSENGGAGSAAGHSFLNHMFEAVSAFNTVGLSLDVTPTLSGIGKWTTIILMFVGRVGPLTFAAALAVASHHRGPPFRYAYEDVVVG